MKGTWRTEVWEVDQRIDAPILNWVLQGHRIPGTLPCLLLPSADRWSCENNGFHCHRLTSLSIGGCPKVWTRNRVTVLGLLLQITYITYFIQKFDLLASFSCFSVSFKIWDLALGSIWHSSNGCSYSLKVSTLYQVKVFLSRSWCLNKGEDRRAFTLYITSCKHSLRYWCIGSFGRIVTLF